MRLRRMWILTLSTFKNNQSSIFLYVIIKKNKLYYLKNKRWQAMKKIVSFLIIICSLLILVACSDDSSYTIDKVTIYAQINDAGHMNVQEVYTYTFDGEFNGMTRTIKSDASNFNAFLLPHDDHQSLGDPDAVDPLSIEVDDDTYKIHTASQDETKTVLYTYEVNGSIEKYQDIGKLHYSFFDKTNDTDINDLSIAIEPPTPFNENDMYAFLYEKGDGSIEKYTNAIVYTNDYLPAKTDSYITFLFPNSALSGMEITNDKNILEKEIEAENDWQTRLTHLQENFDQLKPIIVALIMAILFITVFVIYNHPIRRRSHYRDESLIHLFEGTDPLFISYLNRFRLIDNESMIYALFSLKMRGIIQIEEVTLRKDEKKNTVRFTWLDDDQQIDEADRHLQEWLFIEQTKDTKSFLLEDIIDDKDESDEVRKEKGKEFEKHVNTWKELVLKREEYEHVRHPYQHFKWISMLFAGMCGGVFYYLSTIDILTRQEQIGLNIAIILSILIMIVFSRYKFVLFLYYLTISILSFIFFSLFGGWIFLLYFVALLASLIIPAYYWTEEVAPIKQSMKKASELMWKNKYPVGSDRTMIENRILYAIIMNAGKEYAKQFDQEPLVQEITEASSLLRNYNSVIESLTPKSHTYYSYTRVNRGSSGSSGGSSSSGGGGAGAF